MSSALKSPLEAVQRPETFRQSLLAKFDNCPHSALLYLRHDGGLDSHQKTRGSVFHLFMQRATELMMEQGEPTMPGDMGRELADAIMAEDLGAVLSVHEQDVIRQCAWNWCEATAIDLEALIGVEIALELEIGGVTVTCRIDRAEVHDTTAYLKDAKTSLHVPSQEETDRSFQRNLYSLAFMEGIRPETGLTLGAGLTDVWFDFEYPRYRTEEGPLVIRGQGSTRSELAEFRVSLERNIAAFEECLNSGEWPARKGSWCSECPCAPECPIPAHLREVAEITTEEEAQTAFMHKLALDEEARRYQDGMRGYVKERERPILLGDLAFDASVSQSRSVDWEAIALGKPLQEATTVRSSTKYSKRRQTKEERA